MSKEIMGKLSQRQQEAFDNIACGKVLGAGNHISMILDMILDLSANTSYNDLEKQEYIKELSRYFIATRGKSSYAVVNALERVEALIFNDDASAPPAFTNHVQHAVAQYKEQSQADTEQIITLTQRVLRSAKTIMLFDYSSTVEKAVSRLAGPLTVIVPESRTIDGGRPFLKPLLEAGHQLRFIADAAMGTVLKETDAVLIGAETYYPDGTAFNTAGSEMLAELCSSRNIPYYVLTPTLKCDKRSVQGVYKQVIGADLHHRLAQNWDFDTSGIDFYTVELVPVLPKHITAYITEYGIIPPHHMFDLERRR